MNITEACVRTIFPHKISLMDMASKGTQVSYDREKRIVAAEAAIKHGYTPEILSKHGVKLNTIRGWVGRYRRGVL